MSLKPLRFATGQALYDFRIGLQRNTLIDTSTKLVTQRTIASLSSYFVRGVDGNFYVLNDLKRGEIAATQDAQDEFFYASSAANRTKRVTREQLLSETLSCDEQVLKCIALLVYLNPELYNDLFPKLTCFNDIELFAAAWCNSMADFYAQLEESDRSLRKLEIHYLKKNRLSHEALPLDFINHFKIDILNVTFFQQERLYAYLLTFKNNELTPDCLDDWLEAIAENNRKIKSHLASYRLILEEYRRVYEEKSLDILRNEAKNHQINNLIFKLARSIVSLAMIFGLNWFSLGWLTGLLLYAMFIEPIALTSPVAFILTCLFLMVQESLIVALFAIVTGFIVSFWLDKNKEDVHQVNIKMLQCQQLEEYMASKSTWADLLNHLDLTLKRMDNFLREKSVQNELLPSNQEEILITLEQNNPSKPFAFRRYQEFSDITFFSHNEVGRTSQRQETRQTTLSL